MYKKNQAPTSYDTYDEQSLGRMKFEKALDGSWIRRAKRPPAQARGQGQMHPGVKEEAKIREMKGGLDPQRDFEQREPEFDIPLPPQLEGIHFEVTFSKPMMTEPSYTAEPSSQSSFTELPHIKIPFQAPHALDYASWMDLSAQISLLGTRMEEFALVSDTQFYSMEDRIDQYQTSFTYRFEHFQQRFEHIEERMDQQQAIFEHLQQSIEHIESHQESRHEEIMAYFRSVFPLPPSQP